MKAVQLRTLDGPAAVELVDIEVPLVGPGEVLIEVHAAGVSFPELLQTRGQYQIKPPLPFTLGSEIAGVIAAGDVDAGLQPGDRVAAFCSAGGFADFVAVPANMVVRLPEQTSFEQGAALPVNYLTSYFSLLSRGALQPGEDVLVHGAAGGLGSAAIQIARCFGAGRIIAITSTPEKGAVALDAGADHFILAPEFKDEVRSSGGVDIVVDPVGGSRFTDSMRCLRENGRLLVMGFADGEIPTVKVNRLLLNNISIVGAGWGHYIKSRPGLIATDWAELMPHIRSGALNPILNSAPYPLALACQALELLDDRKATGKVLLIP